MRKNLAAIYIKWAAVQKIQEHHHVTKKAPLINYLIADQNPPEETKIPRLLWHLNT